MPHGVRLIVAYDGTDFSGWQAQAGLRCVQSTVAKAIQQITQHPVAVKGASRTDAGVHAEGQVACFTTERKLDNRRWAMGISRYLPPDVSIRAAEACATDYEPRFDAYNKTYRYLLHLSPLRDPLIRRQAWHLDRQLRHSFPKRDDLAGGRHHLDIEHMRRAAARMLGTHDFQAFRQAADSRTDTVRTMERIELIESYGGHPNLLAIEVRGNAFMKNMVRIMAGTLVEVGRGRMTADAVSAQLCPEAQRHGGGVTAPPEGLTLVNITTGRIAAERARRATDVAVPASTGSPEPTAPAD